MENTADATCQDSEFPHPSSRARRRSESDKWRRRATFASRVPCTPSAFLLQSSVTIYTTLTAAPLHRPHSDQGLRTVGGGGRGCVQKLQQEISRYSVLCLSSATSYGAGELEYLQSIFNLADIVLGGGSGAGGEAGGEGLMKALLLSARAVFPTEAAGQRHDATPGARRSVAFVLLLRAERKETRRRRRHVGQRHTVWFTSCSAALLAASPFSLCGARDGSPPRPREGRRGVAR